MGIDGSLPSGDEEYLKEQVRFFKKHADGMGGIGGFFWFALKPFYSFCEFSGGLKEDEGHIIYRLSDYVPKEKREEIMIYRSEDGSIIEGCENWDSLEDWRNEWEKLAGPVPSLTRELNDLKNLLLPEPKD